MAKIPVGLQMYTLREEAKADFAGTLRKVAEIGYAGVQISGGPPLPAREIRKILDDCGLRSAGTHIPLQTIESDLASAIDYNLEIGSRYLVCPAIPPERRNAESLPGLIESFNRAGEECRRHGLLFGYHNHSFEFAEKVDGKPLLDALLQGTKPDLVFAELDTYWVQHGGENPAEYIRRYAGRCPVLHLKDMEPGSERFFAEVGNGILDWKAIFAAADAACVEWYVVEQDACRRPPIESARISFENMKSWGLV